MGTALNKILKDLVVKSRSMLGHNAVYVPGWDCHGLPIEHQVDKELGLDKASVDVRQAMDPMEKRRRCREYAAKFIDIQREEFKRLGVFGDWSDPVPHDGARLRGGDRARVRPLRGPRPGVQGPEAGALVHALQDRAGPGRGGVRGPDHALGLREVPGQDGRPRRSPARSAGGRSRSSSGRPRRGRCPPTSRSRCTPTETYTAVELDGEALVVAAARWSRPSCACPA